MAAAPQLDPALKQLVLRRTGSLPGEPPAAEAEAVTGEVPVIAKLVDPRRAVRWLRVVTGFGQIVTGRVPLDRILDVREDGNVFSLKASLNHGPVAEADWPASPAAAPAPPTGATGRGVVLAVAGWGCDFVHHNFRLADGRTRLLWLWDQRGGRQPSSPDPFGYGRQFSREQIDAALASADPYGALAYDPADADPLRNGSHDTHVLDIAAGNGSVPGSNRGVAPDAALIFVHLKGDDTAPQDTLGDSARLLEAVGWILDRAGARPVVINCSLGRTGGPHDATPLVVQGLDALLAEREGCAVVLSTGNYFQAGLHRSGRLAAGGTVDLAWQVTPSNDEIAELEVWYAGSDVFDAELIDPNGRTVISVPLCEDRVARADGAIIASAFHRCRDPNNGDNQLDVFLWPEAMLGAWTLRLRGQVVHDGRWHAWIERDDPRFQSRFVSQADPHFTTGTIANGTHTIAVGAYDARRSSNPIAPFSSAGPTRDLRQRPDLVAPGVAIRAARSSLPGPGLRTVDGQTIKSGSSMAAPFVSGVAACMFEAAGSRRLSAEQIRAVLISTARASPPWDDRERLRYGAGRVDAAAAVEAVRALPLTPALVHERAPHTQEQEGRHAMVSVAETSGWPTEPADVDDPLLGRLTAALPLLLVDFGDCELRRRDERGVPVYDPVQPLVFAPTGRRYSYVSGGPNYHAANFVFNSAYLLGYDVPVHPPGSRTASEGDAYLNTTASFQALADGNGLATYLRRYFEVVARPGQEATTAELREGDLLLGARDAGLPLGHLSIIADPQLRAIADPFFQRRDADRGTGVHCIGAGQAIHARADRFGRVLVGQDGRVLADRMAIRFKPSAIDVARVRERLARDDALRRTLDQPRSTEGEATAQWGAGGLCHHLGGGGPAWPVEEAAAPAPGGEPRTVEVAFRYGDGSPMADAVYEAAFGDRRVPGRSDGRGLASVEVPAAHAGPFRLFLRSFPERYVARGGPGRELP